MPTTYLAPGVYVEEVPFTQQPIAGTGTNTVGFIGVVPDEIQVPIPNDDYDPTLGVAAASGPEASQREVDRLGTDIQGLQERQTDRQRALDTANDGLNKPDLEANQKARLEGDRRKLTNELAQIRRDLERKGKERDELRNPKPQSEFLKPYRLETFRVAAEPADSRLCTNFSEYTRLFGTFSADDPEKPGSALSPGHRALTHAVYGFFKNGGTRCFVARVKTDNGAEIDKALLQFESINAIAIIAAPGLYSKDVWGKLVAHCELMEERFAILDCQPDVETADGDVDVPRLDYGRADNILPDRSKNAAFYFPYITVIDPAKQLQDQDPVRSISPKNRGMLCVPPTGHVAGVYARVDEQRGVHKAPGNEAILGAVDVKYYLGKPKQELLNPSGVNCIRSIYGNIIIYGARTIGGDRNGEWKYINVRRVFLYLRDSIHEGTQWAVFEPNDQRLWGKLRLNLTAFLTNVWRSGALFGASSQEAFYVKCDAELNPPEIRDLGQVVVEIGVAIVRPAEFVIFRVSQWTGQKSAS